MHTPRDTGLNDKSGKRTDRIFYSTSTLPEYSVTILIEHRRTIPVTHPICISVSFVLSVFADAVV